MFNYLKKPLCACNKTKLDKKYVHHPTPTNKSWRQYPLSQSGGGTPLLPPPASGGSSSVMLCSQEMFIAHAEKHCQFPKSEVTQYRLCNIVSIVDITTTLTVSTTKSSCKKINQVLRSTSLKRFILDFENIVTVNQTSYNNPNTPIYSKKFKSLFAILYPPPAGPHVLEHSDGSNLKTEF